MATTIYGISPEYAMPKCEHCKLASYCMKQCLGSQYESQGDLFEPNPTVCDLYQTKIVTMYELLKSKNIFNNIQEITEDHLKQTVLNFKLTVEAFLNKEEVQ